MQKAIGWIVAGVLLIVLISTNITRVDVGTVRGDLSDMQAQLTAQAEQPAVIVTNTEVPVVTPTQTLVVLPTITSTPIVVEPTPVEASQEDNGYRKFRKDAAWVGDDFGPEKTLPGTVIGPAIVELKSYMGSVCGLVKVNSGETLTWPGGGAYWEAGSQAALDARWPHHKDEYINHYSNCNVYSSADDVPNPTK